MGPAIKGKPWRLRGAKPQVLHARTDGISWHSLVHQPLDVLHHLEVFFMRRSSFLSILLIAGLLVGLAGGVAIAAGGGLQIQEVPADFTWAFNPAEYHEKTHNNFDDPYSIEIQDNANSWTLDESLSWDTSDPEATRALNDAFSVMYDDNYHYNNADANWVESLAGGSGNGREDINLKFIWDPTELSNGYDDFQYLEAGNYSATVTLTLSVW